MADFSIQPYRPEIPAPQVQRGQMRPAEAGQPIEGAPAAPGMPREEISFRESIRNLIYDVDGMQKEKSRKIEDFMAGEISDVHEVMVAVEKANTSFQLLMELRNKMMDAYQEIKRMSV